jgi:hypothetical protein
VASDAEESLCDTEELVDVPDDESDVCGVSVDWRALDITELPEGEDAAVDRDEPASEPEDDESAVDEGEPEAVDVPSAGGSADATPCPVAVAIASQIATTGKDER